MSATETKALIARAVERLQQELPALKQLKLVVKLELRARGGDAPIWRLEVPGPKIDRDPAGDARVQVSVARSDFNELATEGQLRDWVGAYERGYVHATAGNISVRLDDGFLITPTDACLGFLDPARLARLDSGLRQTQGDRASKTMALHARIYGAASGRRSSGTSGIRRRTGTPSSSFRSTCRSAISTISWPRPT